MTDHRYTDFFDVGEEGRGPRLSDELVACAERKLGVRLPPTYLALLTQRNGGTPRRRCFRTQHPTSWACDHFQVQTLLGIGYDDGLDGEFGSVYMTEEWGYPRIGLVVFDTPSGGHDTVMLDYTLCGPLGEPRVAYVDQDRSALVVAGNFGEFIANLVDCSEVEV